jgi:UDP-N-acetylmuramate--alanine ligase
VKRRFTKTGEVGGITVIDDYPSSGGDRGGAEGGAAGARRDRGGATASVQPSARLFNEFCNNDAGTVIIADVYPAGE